jgi:hypothetical protein
MTMPAALKASKLLDRDWSYLLDILWDATLVLAISGIPSFLNPSDFGTFWPFDRRIRWAKGLLGMARPHQR